MRALILVLLLGIYADSSQAKLTRKNCSSLLSGSVFSFVNTSAEEKIRILRRLQQENKIIELESHPVVPRYSPGVERNREWVTGKILDIYSDVRRRFVRVDREDRIFLSDVKGVRVLGVDTPDLQRRPVVFFPSELKREMQLSSLSDKQWSTIKRGGGRVISITDWLKNYQNYRGAVGLGVDNLLYSKMVAMAELRNFEQLYKELDISLDSETGHTNDFLSQIYGPIVFFLPRDILNYETFSSVDGSNITRDELLWFVDHPERLSRVTFVLGGENSVYFRNESVRPSTLRALVQRHFSSGKPTTE